MGLPAAARAADAAPRRAADVLAEVQTIAQEVGLPLPSVRCSNAAGDEPAQAVCAVSWLRKQLLGADDSSDEGAASGSRAT